MLIFFVSGQLVREEVVIFSLFPGDRSVSSIQSEQHTVSLLKSVISRISKLSKVEAQITGFHRLSVVNP